MELKSAKNGVPTTAPSAATRQLADLTAALDESQPSERPLAGTCCGEGVTALRGAKLRRSSRVRGRAF
jgi:hypothetical protein